MKAYLAVAAGTVFLSVLCSVLVPDGKLKKTVTFSLRMVCLAVLIQPVYNLFSLASEDSADLCDYSFICDAYSIQQESALKSEILNVYGESCSCEITIEFQNGGFVQTAVSVQTESGDLQIISLIYEYLEAAGYININVI